MKKSLLLTWPLVFVVWGLFNHDNAVKSFMPLTQQYNSAAEPISCAPISSDEVYPGNDAKFIKILPGWGEHSYKISTRNDSAQRYFDQGLSMYYSYHFREAYASFKEAARFDGSCAIIYWGQALALGPSYNGGYDYKMNIKVPAVIDEMVRFADQASIEEKNLVQAMANRYDIFDAEDKRRPELNGLYAATLKPLVSRYPDDIEVKALYIDAVMLIHAWDFWTNDGVAKPWTNELIQYCRDILKLNPHHPAALHYYIHLTEASRQPEVALASADSLLKLFPGVAHMVHMSSHEYERIGYYEKGVNANDAADDALASYDSLAGDLNLSKHVSHYYAVETYCALSGAMYKKAIQTALICRTLINPSQEDTYDQYLHMFPLLAMVRMGKWQEIIQDKTFIDASWTYAEVLNDFVKGMAFAKTGDLLQAEQWLKHLQAKKEDSILKILFAPYESSPYECAIVAENILKAVILFGQKKVDESLTYLQKAVAAEDKLLYTEPKLWMTPARQYLGSYLLQLRRFKEAEKIYRQDLVMSPGNGWSLLGLYQTLKAEHKDSEPGKLKELYLASFSKADVLPNASVY